MEKKITLAETFWVQKTGFLPQWSVFMTRDLHSRPPQRCLSPRSLPSTIAQLRFEYLLLPYFFSIGLPDIYNEFRCTVAGIDTSGSCARGCQGFWTTHSHSVHHFSIARFLVSNAHQIKITGRSPGMIMDTLGQKKFHSKIKHIFLS